MVILVRRVVAQSSRHWMADDKKWQIVEADVSAFRDYSDLCPNRLSTSKRRIYTFTEYLFDK